MENFFKRILRGKKIGFMFTTRNLANMTSNGEMVRADGANISGQFVSIGDMVGNSVTVFNGSSYSSGTTNQGVARIMSTPPQTDSAIGTADARKVVEPIAIFQEIKKETPKISFADLDKKIEVVEERIKILGEHMKTEQMVDEHKALFFLKNRRTYLKTQKKNPLDWAMTTKEAIADLCKTYKLKSVPLKQYYTLVPKEGIKEIERFTKAYKAVTGDTPIFELVVKDTQVVEQKKKDRDPILLANSPLGNFLFILGAWDDEVQYVDEIIYGGK